MAISILRSPLRLGMAIMPTPRVTSGKSNRGSRVILISDDKIQMQTGLAIRREACICDRPTNTTHYARRRETSDGLAPAEGAAMLASRKLWTFAVATFLSFPVGAAAIGCSSSGDEATSENEERETNDEAVATGSSELGTCYCAQPYTCGHSSSPSYMYSAAHSAMLRAGVPDSQLTQTYGDAPASVGTHCPEPGTSYSAATDVTPSSNPCGRVHNLRMQGFAAWYRVPPSFSYHIHAVYAGTPSLKSSLKSQLSSFAQGRNGLADNAVDNICPISQAEKNAVAQVHGGGGSSGSCVPGGRYCGGDKVSGNANTLYRCGSDGKSASVIRSCTHGCSVNSGTDDSCRCSPGGAYCGGDVIDGNANTLYRCSSNGVSTTVISQCANGCRVNSGTDDSCK